MANGTGTNNGPQTSEVITVREIRAGRISIARFIAARRSGRTGVTAARAGSSWSGGSATRAVVAAVRGGPVRRRSAGEASGEGGKMTGGGLTSPNEVLEMDALSAGRLSSCIAVLPLLVRVCAAGRKKKSRPAH